ncbi:MAG: hypothetical protein IPF67_03455 [Saprospiraceae bacterium]|nr:hypothetical protein [Candidatus Brachybacter algidus]
MGRQYSGYIQRSPDDRDHSKEHQQKAQADEEKPMQGARHEAVPFKASGEIVQRKPADDKKLPLTVPMILLWELMRRFS